MLPVQAKREIIYRYTDLVGMITVDRNPSPESTKNGLMSTGLILCYFYALNILDKHDIANFIEVVERCQEVPGDYDRYPGYANKPRNDDANAQDDYTGVFAGSKISNQHFHKDILEHGIKYLFVYNNKKPGVLVDDINPLKWEWWAFRLRFFDHILWYYLGNNRLRLFSPLLMLWIATKALTSKVGYGRLLDYMFVESLAIDKWEWKKFRKWFLPRSKLVESNEDYFKKDHASNDLARFVVRT